jgi:hypothetical protein
LVRAAFVIFLLPLAICVDSRGELCLPAFWFINPDSAKLGSKWTKMGIVVSEIKICPEG